MKITELKNWNTLTADEQKRLRDVYQVDENDNLPESFTKTMAQPAPIGTEVITPKEGSTVVVNAENVVVNEKEDDNG